MISSSTLRCAGPRRPAARCAPPRAPGRAGRWSRRRRCRATAATTAPTSVARPGCGRSRRRPAPAVTADTSRSASAGRPVQASSARGASANRVADRLAESVEADALRGDRRDHRGAEPAAQPPGVELGPRRLGLVHHVEGDDDGDARLGDLQHEVQRPFDDPGRRPRRPPRPAGRRSGRAPRPPPTCSSGELAVRL